MAQAFAASQVVAEDGEYRVRATRIATTDLLSVYVNRVKKLHSDSEEVIGVLRLQAGDVVESTGELTIE